MIDLKTQTKLEAVALDVFQTVRTNKGYLTAIRIQTPEAFDAQEINTELQKVLVDGGLDFVDIRNAPGGDELALSNGKRNLIQSRDLTGGGRIAFAQVFRAQKWRPRLSHDAIPGLDLGHWPPRPAAMRRPPPTTGRPRRWRPSR